MNNAQNYRTSDYADLWNNEQAQVSISGTADQTPELPEGIYDVWTDVDCYIKVDEDASGVTTSNGYLLRADNTIPIYVRSGHKIGVIGTSGTLSYHRIG